ncbi:hypothetical protein PPACK8108_LOCUS183 [Phakopsora pachyrhizi]|uniref:Uncharacterized protein n=1 Tax=Phakopsora pachyrhizi TaxID=170000 RepID=A0AAV0AFM0_PHAPC|nr:hypothetical protein PPACK8108_LOCUS183 [Phakopsora pachyrhizi]
MPLNSLDCEREMEKELRLVERMERLIRKDEEAEEDDDNDCANLLGVKVLPVGTACCTWQVTDENLLLMMMIRVVKMRDTDLFDLLITR